MIEKKSNPPTITTRKRFAIVRRVTGSYFLFGDNIAVFSFFALTVVGRSVCISKSRLTVCVSRWWAGVDSAGEQEKPEARKMLENGAESHQSAARCVRRRFVEVPHRCFEWLCATFVSR